MKAGALLRERITRVAFEFRRARVNPSEEAVHDLRVAIRRLLAAARVFRPAMGKPRYQSLRQRLKPVLKASAAVRDRDIALALLGEFKARQAPPLRVRLCGERRQAAAALQAALRRGPALSRCEEYTVAKLPLKPLAKFFSLGERAARPGSTWNQLHEFRLHAKRFRYLLEMFAPHYGWGLERRLEMLRKLQQVLGGISDLQAVMDLDAVRECQPLLDWLRERRGQGRQRFRRLWKQEFDGLRRNWHGYLERKAKK